MDFLIVLGVLCMITGGLLIPFHEKVGAQMFHAFGFMILGVVLAAVPLFMDVPIIATMIPLQNWLILILFFLLMIAFGFMVWFFRDGDRQKAVISVIATVVLAVAMVVTIFALNPSDYNDAIVIAQMAVEENLKNPGSAEFSPSSETTVEQVDEDTYIVTGWVRASNGFGGMVTNVYTVKYTYNSDGSADIEYCRFD